MKTKINALKKLTKNVDSIRFAKGGNIITNGHWLLDISGMETLLPADVQLLRAKAIEVGTGMLMLSDTQINSVIPKDRAGEVLVEPTNRLEQDFRYPKRTPGRFLDIAVPNEPIKSILVNDEYLRQIIEVFPIAKFYMTDELAPLRVYTVSSSTAVNGETTYDQTFVGLIMPLRKGK